MQDQKSKIKDQKQETSNTGNSSKATTMADLMRSVKTTFRTLHKGESISGTITKLTPSEILVDLGAKTEATVLEKDKKLLRTLLSTLKVGDNVTVSVLNPESDAGNPVVSLRRFLDDLIWNRLTEKKEKKQPMEIVIAEITKGGFLVSTDEAVKGFLPNSYTTLNGTEDEDLRHNVQGLIGKKVKAYILELDKPAHKVIFSQKPVVGAEEFETAIKSLKVGQKVEVTVSNITTFGAFATTEVGKQNVDSDRIGVDGLIHISEIAWDKVSNLEEMFDVGQKIEAVVIGFDHDSKRIDLSVKRLTEDPFDEISKKYKLDQKVQGVVSELLSTGVALDLGEETVEGLIRKEKIPPTVNYQVGDKVNAIVTQIDNKKRKILLVPVLLEKFVGYK